MSSNILRPNHELTDRELSEKRGLKRLLKRQMRRRKLEVRLNQAIMRKDAVTEQFSRVELDQFLREEENELFKTQSMNLVALENDYNTSSSTILPKEHRESEAEQAKAQYDIEELYQTYYDLLEKQLESKQNGNSEHYEKTPKACDTTNGTLIKDHQKAEARVLLINMTKGTQTVDMFENSTALMGYVRQKFQERACLAISSLCKLDPRRADLGQQPPQFWNLLLACRSICSIGCGPGCDVLGLVKFLQCFAATPKDETLVDRVIFLDWTMDKWEPFLRPLIDGVLIPQKYVASADCVFGDVLRPLSEDCNQTAKDLLFLQEEGGVDLYVTSYLLTETRGKWHDFYRDIIDMAKPGALFLFAEPKAWQLHSLMEQHGSTKMEYVWLDSSMYSPMMQALEGRVGPAVLLCRKL
ncbi:expressed unknown protein [Seminavis robusta]|uniref:Uncharacterized protein n=1 Tax=Seminavis robusta TaxID=568900 RepID=A0A9N8EVE3_9STRA|nr:expressed unknown protein [Seminavis robusta]|eukprot:Sro1874_g303000.1 n/a (412) ;mRNA; r:17361-18596